MGITLLSLRQAQKVEPQLRAALIPGAEALTARERLAKRDGHVQAPLTARQYVQKLSSRARELEREQMNWALGRVEPAELEALVRQIARLKGRHATLVLEQAQGERPMRPQQLAEIRALREQVHELEQGLEVLKDAILEGTAQITGVRMGD